MIDPVTAISLGVKSIPVISTGGVVGNVADAGGVGSFSDVLMQSGSAVVDKMQQAETISLEALRGNAGPREVAEAVMEAEQTLQIAIAVRDKIVTAYLEISRMAI